MQRKGEKQPFHAPAKRNEHIDPVYVKEPTSRTNISRVPPLNRFNHASTCLSFRKYQKDIELWFKLFHSLYLRGNEAEHECQVLFLTIQIIPTQQILVTVTFILNTLACIQVLLAIKGFGRHFLDMFSTFIEGHNQPQKEF